MNVPIATFADFKATGEIVPRYVRLDGVDYKIQEIEYSKEEIYAGISTVRFCCYVERVGKLERIMIRFHRNTTQWVQIN